MQSVRHHLVCALSGQTYDLVMRAGPRLDFAAEEVLECLLALDERNQSLARHKELFIPALRWAFFSGLVQRGISVFRMDIVPSDSQRGGSITSRAEAKKKPG